MSRSSHLSLRLISDIVCLLCWNVLCHLVSSLTLAMLLFALHSLIIFRLCPQIIMISSLFSGVSDTVTWWYEGMCAGSGWHLLMKWTLDMITDHCHTRSDRALSQLIIITITQFSPRSDTSHDMTGGSAPSGSGSPCLSLVTASGHQCHEMSRAMSIHVTLTGAHFS